MSNLDRPVPPLSEASVAVLPLRNLTGNPSDGYFCDGIASDIIISLSRFRDLLVIARHSSFAFKDRDLSAEEIGRQLNARYLLTGGWESTASGVALEVELTEASSGRRLWSDRYRGRLLGIFEFQDDITDLVSARLSKEIRSAERRRLARNPHCITAYGLNLQARELSLRYKLQANRRARRLFEAAVQIDPANGRSYAGLARTFNMDSFYAWTPSPAAARDRALELARRATLYDRFDSRGYSELGFSLLYAKRHEESLSAYRRALELNPNDADVLSDMADSLTYSDRPREAIALLERAMRLNPFYPDDYLWHLGDVYFNLADYERTIQTLYQMQDQSEAHRLLAACHALLGNREEARYHADCVMKAHPNFTVDHWRWVPPFKDGAPQLDALIDGLRTAGLR